MTKLNLHPFNLALVGYRENGAAVYVSETTLAYHGLRNIREALGLPLKEFPVKTDFGENDYVLVEADSHEEAVEKYLRSKRNAQTPHSKT